MNKDRAFWLNKLMRLNVDKSTGDPAPHKPLLLLCVIEMVEQKLLIEPKLTRSPDLVLRFQSYWRVVAHRRSARPDLRMPFHHLSSDGFWQPFTSDGRPSLNRDNTDYCILEISFFGFLLDKEFRLAAKEVLIFTYFRPEEQIGLCTLTGLEVKHISEKVAQLSEEEVVELKKQGRDARFRINVVSAYHFTCALTGYCLMSKTGATIVEAAHIHAFSDSRNNEPQNGLALSKNAHWLFDEGLWTITDKFKIAVATDYFIDSSPNGISLNDYRGQPLFFPPQTSLRPNLKYLAWHRQNKYLGEI